MKLLKTISFFTIAATFSFNINAASSAEGFIQERNPVFLKTKSLPIDTLDLHQGREIAKALEVSPGVSKVIIRQNPEDFREKWQERPEFLRALTVALNNRSPGSLDTIVQFRIDDYVASGWAPKNDSDNVYLSLLKAFQHTSPHLKTFVWVRNNPYSGLRFWSDNYERLTRQIFPNLEMTDFKVLTGTGKLKNNFKWVSNSDGTQGIAHNQDYFDSSSRLTW